MKLETLTQVNVERAARRPVIVITDTANGEQRLVKAKDIATDPLSTELSKQLRMGKSGMVESGGSATSGHSAISGTSGKRSGLANAVRGSTTVTS